MSSSVTVVTAAFGRAAKVLEWAEKWSSLGCRCIASDNGGCAGGRYPEGVRILEYRGNPGFGAGINRAVEAAETPLIIITNPDTFPLHDGSLSSLLENHEGNTLSSGIMVDEKSSTVNSTGIWPDINWVKRQIFRPAESLWNADRFDWLQGSLILAGREEFLNLGGFSPGYPLYFEDVDLCAKAIRAGMDISLNTGSRFVHQEGTGSSGSSAVRLSCFHWGMGEFFRNHRPGEFPQARKLILLKCLLRAAALLPLNPGSARGYATGFYSVFRGTPPPLPERSHD